MAKVSTHNRNAIRGRIPCTCSTPWHNQRQAIVARGGLVGCPSPGHQVQAQALIDAAPPVVHAR